MGFLIRKRLCELFWKVIPQSPEDVVADFVFYLDEVSAAKGQRLAENLPHSKITILQALEHFQKKCPYGSLLAQNLKKELDSFLERTPQVEYRSTERVTKKALPHV